MAIHYCGSICIARAIRLSMFYFVYEHRCWATRRIHRKKPEMQRVYQAPKTQVLEGFGDSKWAFLFGLFIYPTLGSSFTCLIWAACRDHSTEVLSSNKFGWGRFTYLPTGHVDKRRGSNTSALPFKGDNERMNQPFNGRNCRTHSGPLPHSVRHPITLFRFYMYSIFILPIFN